MLDKGKPSSKAESKPVKCFNCGKTGHNSPACQERKQNCKRVGTPQRELEQLDKNEAMVSINGILCLMTLDTGAKVTLVPKEVVPSQCFTGATQLFKGVDRTKGYSEGAVARVEMNVLDQTREMDVLAVPGEHLGWVGALKFDITNQEIWVILGRLAHQRDAMTEEEATYTPLKMREGEIQGAVWPFSGGMEEGPQTSSEEPIARKGRNYQKHV